MQFSFQTTFGKRPFVGKGLAPLWFDGFSVDGDGCEFEVVSFAVVGVIDFGGDVVEGGGERIGHGVVATFDAVFVDCGGTAADFVVFAADFGHAADGVEFFAVGDVQAGRQAGIVEADAVHRDFDSGNDGVLVAAACEGHGGGHRWRQAAKPA